MPMLPYFPFGQHFNDKVGTFRLSESDRLVEPDDRYETEVILKRQLLAALPSYYFQAMAGTETAQWEVLEAVLTSLSLGDPLSFSLDKAGRHWRWTNRRLGVQTDFSFGEADSLPLAPLDWVGRQVQEDLLLLAGSGPALVAGQLCFGNGWCLDDKMGLPFWQIHAPIVSIVTPMLEAAQTLMERLPAGRPVWRLNWSLKLTDQLDMTSRHSPFLDRLLAEESARLTPDTIGNGVCIRIERQTLTRLPRSGAILFGIHTHQNRLRAEVTERPDAAVRLTNVLQTTPPAMLDYKGITPFLPALLTYLSSVSPSNHRYETPHPSA